MNSPGNISPTTQKSHVVASATPGAGHRRSAQRYQRSAARMAPTQQTKAQPLIPGEFNNSRL